MQSLWIVEGIVVTETCQGNEQKGKEINSSFRYFNGWSSRELAFNICHILCITLIKPEPIIILSSIIF